VTLLLSPAISLSAQVVINEFCASNTRTIADPDYNEYSDWLELYNTGTAETNLLGYYLTDNLGSPGKWQITVDAVIEPGGYLLIWTDGRNTGLHSGFKISADGEELALFNPGLVLVDSITFLPQTADISYGRTTDGGAEWGFFPEPTPGSANTTESYPGLVFSIPTFSLRGGCYTSPQTLAITSEFGGEVRFTTDGSDPVESSGLFSGPLEITSTTIVRARVCRPGMLPGPVITNSYFISENSADGKLPLVSIATDPGNFWDPETGIYTQDFKPEWEVPVNIELFENNGADRAAFNRRAGIKINGLYSWQLPQKMLGVYFKKGYGPGNLDYRVTPQRNRSSYKSFALRASGSDWSYTLFRDVLAHHATLYNMDIDIMGFKPSVVFLNGEYLGIHNIREKVDADYIEQSYRIEPGSFDLVENQDYPEAGDMEAYDHLRELLRKDLSVAANYDAVADLVDIENFTDMTITEMACRNTSIDHNVMAWKPKVGGKWRWVLMDLDRGFFHAGSNFINFYLSQQQLILRDLFENQGYREYFAGRLATHLFTTFSPERMTGLIDQHESAIESEVPRHIDRWYGTTSDYGDAMPSMEYWRNEVCNLQTFVAERPASLLADLQNYGYPEPSFLAVDCAPGEAGRIMMNGLKAPGPLCYGPYLRDMETEIEAVENPGYDFTGWYEVARTWIIPPETTWKFLDTGVDPGPSWKSAGFDDGSWGLGQAQLGYGDNDEHTVVSYGGNPSGKHITTWFRKPFNLTADQIQNGVFFIHILRDDGAVVYLNETEIARLNIPCGDTGPQTRAVTSLNGETENIYIAYRVDNELLKAGLNQLAVEVHQSDASSSDLSFDLGLSCYLADDATLVSEEPLIRFTLSDDRFLSARYSENGDCVIPGVITEDMTISADCSPYQVQEHIVIPEHVTLNIDPGVEIQMPPGGNIYIYGVLNANGTGQAPVTFRLNPEEQGQSWGGMVFRNTGAPSTLSHVTVEDASEGPDPVLEYAAISAFNADLVMDHLIVEKVCSNPIVSRYSDIILTNSTLHSEVTGDLINVKYGNALIEDCRFTGNDQPDADAIDYDETGTGVIRNCTFSGFYGLNSDAVDIGEDASGIVIDSVFVLNVRDKGVSVGQRSTATVKNSVFINCGMGVAVKDSSYASIQNCVFYSTGNPVACYEKNIGLAGGNARVVNSILSNSSGDSYMADGKSAITLTYSLSDNLPLPDGYSNIFGNPLFESPAFFDFSLLPASPGIMSGSLSGQPVDMGISLRADGFEPPVMISRIFINASDLDLPQFIVIYNPADMEADLSGYGIDKGFTAVLPEGLVIWPKGRVFITSDSDHEMWDDVIAPVVEWSAGRLSFNGESLQLVDPHGVVVDYLVYDDNTWPQEGFRGDEVFRLTDPRLDNHFAENWTTEHLADALVGVKSQEKDQLIIYPNPTIGTIHIEQTGTGISTVTLFDISGKVLGQYRLNPSGTTEVDLSGYGPGIYLLRSGTAVQKIVVAE
jgi:hypothetical protein